MNITILAFSPSGNTTAIANRLKLNLEQKGETVQLLNMTGHPALFSDRDYSRFLREAIAPHDVLCVGGPVYAYHLQYHLLDLLKALPKPGNGWGRYAVPFVTYGGLCSGIALEEAGGVLSESGRTVLAGMKIAASHNMTRAFMEHPINGDLPGDEIVPIIEDLCARILTARSDKMCSDQTDQLKYQPREVAHAANTMFIEKEWHATRYPKVRLHSDACIGCGQCAAVCPVMHLRCDASGKAAQYEASPCIHCFNCVVTCPAKAISLQGDPEKAKMFMANMMKHGNETPGSAMYPALNM